MTHSRRPWTCEIGKGCAFIFDEEGKTIAIVGDSLSQWKENALLIQASAELYHTAQLVVDAYEVEFTDEIINVTPEYVRLHGAINMLRKAMRKAKDK